MKFRRKVKKHLKKAKQVTELVPDTVIEKAVQMNPLAQPKAEEPINLENVPRITTESIGEHREEVLSGARKYILPLPHSKHRIVVVTSTILVAAIVAFLAYCSFALYRFYQYNTFLYRVTQVVPFPIAKADGKFVDYENYLFELRHYVHYYQYQLQTNLNDPNYKQQQLNYRKTALNDVVNNAYVKILAEKNHVSVSEKEVDSRINEVRDQNRLGSSNKVFADVLRNYWGWSINDFRRSLKDEILSEKVVAKLDTQTTQRANNALAQLKAGADFANLAKSVSDDPSAKDNSGSYGFGITKTNPNISPQVVGALFSLKPGQISGVINAGSTLEIVRVETNDGTTVTGRHISFKLKDISTFIDPLKKQHPPHTYVRF